MFWKLCDAPSDLLSPSTKSEDPPSGQPYAGLSYDSIYTYNTEKNFRNKYGAFVEEEIPLALVAKERSLSDKIIETLFVMISSMFLGLSFPFSLFFCLKFVSSYEKLVVMRLGRLKGVQGPGIALVLPFIDTSSRIDIRVTRFELPTIQVVTNDRAILEFSAAAFIKCVDPTATCCGIQDKDQTLKSLAYTTIYKRFVKRSMDDITNPEKANHILEKVQEELNIFSSGLGIEFTKININQLKVVKQGENPAISLFNAFVKSDAGSQIIGQVGSGLKAYLDANSANQQTENNLVMQNGNANVSEIPMANVNSTQDPDINKLIERINRCCNESLVLKVGKCFRLRCICSTSEFCEFILDLSSGNGHCGFVESTWPENIDVVITVRKDTLLALINGDISPISAYIDGSIQIQGSVADATLLRFLAERAKEIE